MGSAPTPSHDRRHGGLRPECDGAGRDRRSPGRGALYAPARCAWPAGEERMRWLAVVGAVMDLVGLIWLLRGAQRAWRQRHDRGSILGPHGSCANRDRHDHRCAWVSQTRPTGKAVSLVRSPQIAAATGFRFDQPDRPPRAEGPSLAVLKKRLKSSMDTPVSRRRATTEIRAGRRPSRMNP